MDHEVRCPVCRSTMQVPQETPPVEQTCKVCGTSFKLPLRRREAVDGQDDKP